MNVLGVPVSADLYERWAGWLAPEMQPFFVESLRDWPSGARPGGTLSAELGHTYRTWRIDRSLETLWLDEATFSDMPRARRAALVRAQVGHGRGAVPSVRRWSDVLDQRTVRVQADGHRFLWWPSLVASNPHAVLPRVIDGSPDGASGRTHSSVHDTVPEETWTRCSLVLPDARRVAGSFPTSSGPNCFGTVMGAAGVAGAAHERVLQARFDEWLLTTCRPGGRDGDPGTVLVWRDGSGDPVHAAVTIGGGWVLEKASEEWWTPRAIRSAAAVIKAARAPSQRLERHRIRV
jgi:hypothetical protein